MPTSFLEVANASSGDGVDTKMLVPGIEPGGSRAGMATKPALLIRNAWFEFQNLTEGGVAADVTSHQLYLKLSQELDTSPGLLLPVANVYGAKTATAQLFNSLNVEQTFHAQGTVWAPRIVGFRHERTSGAGTLTGRIFIEYETVPVPWMDWFIMWDFIDNVPDNTLEY